MRDFQPPLHQIRPYSRYDLCFDLDGTLIDTAPDLVRVTNESIALEGLGPTDYRTARKEVGFGSKVLLRNAMSRANHSVTETRLNELQQFFLKRYADTIADQSQPFPHVRKTLADLKRGGAKLSICTNKPGYLARPLIEALAMTHFFDAIVGGDEAPRSKPHASHIFAAAGQRRAGRTLVMIGDSYPDIRAGHNAGVSTILLDYGYTTTPFYKLKPTLALSNFRLIPLVLDQL